MKVCGGPVGRTPHVYCWVPGFTPWSGNYNPQASHCPPPPKKKKRDKIRGQKKIVRAQRRFPKGDILSKERAQARDDGGNACGSGWQPRKQG